MYKTNNHSKLIYSQIVPPPPSLRCIETKLKLKILKNNYSKSLQYKLYLLMCELKTFQCPLNVFAVSAGEVGFPILLKNTIFIYPLHNVQIFTAFN
jgi:hypothetical protein